LQNELGSMSQNQYNILMVSNCPYVLHDVNQGMKTCPLAYILLLYLYYLKRRRVFRFLLASRFASSIVHHRTSTSVFSHDGFRLTLPNIMSTITSTNHVQIKSCLVNSRLPKITLLILEPRPQSPLIRIPKIPLYSRPPKPTPAHGI
jgi:hypothetical protein